jgi:hypothetical protein
MAAQWLRGDSPLPLTARLPKCLSVILIRRGRPHAKLAWQRLGHQFNDLMALLLTLVEN